MNMAKFKLEKLNLSRQMLNVGLTKPRLFVRFFHLKFIGLIDENLPFRNLYLDISSYLIN